MQKCTVPPLLTGPPLSRYLLYPDITMNSRIIDFYCLFTSVIRIFHLSGHNLLVQKVQLKRGGTVLLSYIDIYILTVAFLYQFCCFQIVFAILETLLHPPTLVPKLLTSLVLNIFIISFVTFIQSRQKHN